VSNFIISFFCSVFHARAFVLRHDPYNFFSQILVALRLSDMVSVGRGDKARLFQKRIRMTFLVIFVIVNVPSLIGCWIAASTYCCPVCSRFACILFFLTPGRYLRDAAIASQLELRLNNSSQLLAEAAKSSSERNVAFVWELAAQSIMYILSCAAIVFTCLFASKRMRKLNAKLEDTALVEVAVAPGQLVASASSHTDDSKSSLVKTFVLVSKRDLTDVRLSSANAAVRDKVHLN
jgi:hypothetical protein